MKAYGHSRRDMLCCRFGCCMGKSCRLKNARPAIDRCNRKTARQQAQQEVKANLDD